MYYKIYDLIVSSEIRLNELVEVKDTAIEPNITIEVEELPLELQEKISRGIKIEEMSNNVWYTIPNVATFQVSNGRSIKVFPYEGSLENSINTYILGTSMGMLMIQRNELAIHGTGISFGEEGIIVCGDRGAGKSTLATAFRSKGFKLLADDVSVLRKADKDYSITPAFPQQKLCRDTLKEFGLNEENYNLINIDRIKYAVPLKEEFEDVPKVLSGIFILAVGEEDSSVSMEKVIGCEKINIIMNNIFRVQYAQNVGIKSSYFKSILEIVEKIPVYRLKRPINKFTVEEQINKILDWRECKW